MNTKFQEIFYKVQNAVLRYPLVLMMSLIMMVSSNVLVDNNFTEDSEFMWIKLVIVSGIGISLLFALKILSQRMKKGIWGEILGILFLIGFYFILPKKENSFPEFYFYLLVPVYVMSHLLVSFSAFAKREYSERHFWQYNKSLFVNFFLTLVFTGVLTGGVLLAFLAVDNLFNVGFHDDLYGRIFVSLLIFGSTVIFLLFNETGLDFLEKEDNYPVVLKFFTQYVLIPLLFIYAVILYFYTAKILLNWELPRGWVSYLVLAYSLIGILALLLVHPLKESHAKSWVKMFSKVFYFTLIPLVILLFTAIFTRVLEYGYTEPRYFVLLLAVWLSSVVLYFIFRKNPTIKFIPISLFCFGLFALIFPYFNAFSVTKRSQKNELEKILADHHLLVNGKIDFEKETQDTVINQIIDKFEFLADRSEKEYLHQFLDEKMQAEFKGNGYWDLYPKFTRKKISPNTNQSVYLNLVSKTTTYQIGEYQYLITPQNVNKPIRIGNDSIRLLHETGRKQSYELILNENESVDFIPKIDSIFDQYKGARNSQEVDQLSVEGDLGKYRVKIFFKSINWSKYGNEPATYWLDNPTILIKENP